MTRGLFVSGLCSLLALVLLGPGGLGVRPAISASQDSTSAARRESPAAVGDLDPGFGNGGKQTTDFFGNADAALGTLIQPDGKIILAGLAQHADSVATSDFALARYNPDGTLDPGFGASGKQTTDFFGNRDQADSVALQADGKIIAAGLAQHGDGFSTADFALARYNPDGTLDQTFGAAGKQTTDFFGNTDLANSVVIQPDGKIVVAGYAQRGASVLTIDFALARYNADGSLDQSFGSGGKLTTDFFGGLDVANSVAIQPDGKIVAAGSASSALHFALVRYNRDGSLDQSFGSGGKQTTDFADVQGATGLAVEPDGKIVVVGTTGRGPGALTFDFALARYNSGGSLDQSFGSGGKQDTDFSGISGHADGVAIQQDGKIVAAGWAQLGASSSTSDFALARYNPDGSLDQSFGSSGKVLTDFFGNADQAAAVAIQADSKIVVAGLAKHGDSFSTSDFALARYSAGADFTISFNTSSVTAQAGTKTPVTVLINRTGGFNGNVTVTPPAAAMGIKPKPPDPLTITGDSAVFKMKVGGGVPPGSYDRTFTAADDSGRTRTATLTIVVQ